MCLVQSYTSCLLRAINFDQNNILFLRHGCHDAKNPGRVRNYDPCRGAKKYGIDSYTPKFFEFTGYKQILDVAFFNNCCLKSHIFAILRQENNVKNVLKSLEFERLKMPF